MNTIIPHLREASFNDADTLPANFDPQQYPILARHWFALHKPAKPSAEVVDLNLIRLVVVLHRLGETIGADVGNRGDMLKRLASVASPSTTPSTLKKANHQNCRSNPAIAQSRATQPHEWSKHHALKSL